MKTSIRDELRKELIARGFSTNLQSPHGGIVLSDSYSTAAEVVDLLVIMVARREKLFRPTGVVPPDVAKRDYDDTVLAVDAIRAVLSRLTLP